MMGGGATGGFLLTMLPFYMLVSILSVLFGDDNELEDDVTFHLWNVHVNFAR